MTKLLSEASFASFDIMVLIGDVEAEIGEYDPYSCRWCFAFDEDFFNNLGIMLISSL